MQRIFSILTIGLFFSFLAVPPLLSVVTPDLEISQAEKRKLCLFPDMDWSVENLVAFPEEFESYYNDHYGLRDLLVQNQQLFSFKIFKVSSSENVTAGKENWLFFNGEGADTAYLGLLRVSAVDRNYFQWVLRDRRDWVVERGGKYIFLPVPNKESVYQEFLPWWIRSNAGLSLYDQLVPERSSKTGFLEYIDLKAEFLDLKHEKQLYFKTDSHWNLYGAFAAYEKVTDMLGAGNISMRALREEDIQWKRVKFSGDLARYLHLYNTITENAPEIDSIAPCEGDLPNAGSLDRKGMGEQARFQRFADDPRKFKRIQKCSQNYTSVLLMHDSFALFLIPFLSNSFGTVYTVNYGFNDVKDFIEEVRPDVVIDQRVERNLLIALEPDRELEDEMVKKQFSQSDITLLQLDARSGDEVDISAGVQISRGDDGLWIHASQAYPTLKMQYDPGKGETSLIVQLRLSSDRDTQCMVYYTTADNAQFISRHTRGFEIHKGYNELFFRLPSPGSFGQLQFQPGVISGTYLLHSLVVKR